MIGRELERSKLINAFRANESKFAAVYGRRRVGKTYLVRKTFGEKFTFQHAGLANSNMKKQLEAWASSLRFSFGKKVAKPKTWIDAFDQLKELIMASDDEKKVIFIDEMPWMDTRNSNFIPALEAFWNGWASGRSDILLIVCGSATSWITNKLIKAHGGLHNRVNVKVPLKPFNLHECEQYSLEYKLGMSRRQILEAYMILGGIPYYWSLLDKKKSLAQNIDSLFFHKDGDLYGEYNELYASIFRTPDAYIKIVETLGKKKSGMTREELILEGKMKDNGKLSEQLEDLENCGFIRKYRNLEYESKFAVYKLVDFYTIFYFDFLKANKHQDENFWSHNQIGTGVYNAWCGLAFERLCMEHLPQIKHVLGISGILSSCYAWRANAEGQKKGAQVDMVIDRADGIVNLCEMKFTKNTYRIDESEYNSILNRIVRLSECIGKDKAVRPILISANGLVQNEYSDDIQCVIDSDNLFLSVF